eukprot:1141042-Pelagomonas_calceolata.AAC.8
MQAQPGSDPGSKRSRSMCACNMYSKTICRDAVDMLQWIRCNGHVNACLKQHPSLQQQHMLSFIQSHTVC